MRSIKFRGKAIRKDKDMWLYGNLIKIGDSYHILEKEDMIEDGHHITQDSDRPTWVEDESIGQFTGLYDKNGKEIYEGDIVTFPYWHDSIFGGFVQIGKPSHCEVVYDDGSFVIKIDGELYHLGGQAKNVVEVVGNIYDNQDLLA